VKNKANLFAFSSEVQPNFANFYVKCNDYFSNSHHTMRLFSANIQTFAIITRLDKGTNVLAVYCYEGKATPPISIIRRCSSSH